MHSLQRRLFEKSINLKPTVIIFTGFYLPGYKSGGILRNVLNTVNNLSTYCNFRVVTKDRDLGDQKRYEDVPIENWTPVENALVFYLPEDRVTIKNLHKIFYLLLIFSQLK